MGKKMTRNKNYNLRNRMAMRWYKDYMKWGSDFPFPLIKVKWWEKAENSIGSLDELLHKAAVFVEGNRGLKSGTPYEIRISSPGGKVVFN